MSKRRPTAETVPSCYAMVLPGLEAVAAEEIEQSLDADVKRTADGVVVFKVPEITPRLLRLKTVEDVFVLAWGTDQLSYRAEDLERIRKWTSYEADWGQLLKIHHSIRPKPKGRPNYRLVAQMTGHHGYRRVDARKAMAQGLEGKIPASWPHVEDHAALEIWLTINEATAVCGVRLSDRSMRHRTYKESHVKASLRPTVAAAMVRLAGATPEMTVLDPMCGAGTILAEQLAANRGRSTRANLWGGDLDQNALRAAGPNLQHAETVLLARWDAGRLPLPPDSVDRIVCNPPFGKQLSSPDEIAPLYRRLAAEANRVLKPDGKAVLLVSDMAALREAVKPLGWRTFRQLRVRVLGQLATVSVWHRTP